MSKIGVCKIGQVVSFLQGLTWFERVALVFLTVFLIMLPYSPAAIEVSVIALFLLWLAAGIREHCFLKKKTTAFFFTGQGLDLSLGIMCVLWLIIALTSSEPQRTVMATIFKSLEWVLIFFMFRRFLRVAAIRTWLMGCLTATLWVTLMDGIVQYFIGRDLFRGHALVEGVRVSAGFKHPNDLAAFLAVVLPWIASRLMRSEMDKKSRWMWALLSIIWLIVFFLTFSRGAWTAALIGSVIYGLGVSVQWKRGKWIVMTTGFVVFSMFLALYPEVKNTFHERRDSVSFRFDLMKDCFAMLRERLWTGWGAGRFMEVYQSFQYQHYGKIKYEPTYAHNCYMQIAVETGLVGLAGFLGFLIVLLKEIRRDGRSLRLSSLSGQALDGDSAAVAWVWACGLVIFLIHATFDTHFFGVQLNALFGFLLALWWSYHKMSEASQSAGAGHVSS